MNNDSLAMEARIKELEQIRDRQQQRLNNYRGQVAAMQEVVERAYNADCERGDDGGVCEGEAANILQKLFTTDVGVPEAAVIKKASLIRTEELTDFEAALGEPRCECDSSVGMTPCMDCVLHQGLTRLRRVYEAVQIMLAEKK